MHPPHIEYQYCHSMIQGDEDCRCLSSIRRAFFDKWCLFFLESLHRYSSNFSWVNSAFSRSSVAVLNSKAWSFTNFQNFSSLVLASFFQSVSSISSGGGNGLQIKVRSDGGRGKLNLQVVPPFLQLFEWFLVWVCKPSTSFNDSSFGWAQETNSSIYFATFSSFSLVFLSSRGAFFTQKRAWMWGQPQNERTLSKLQYLTHIYPSYLSMFILIALKCFA